MWARPWSCPTESWCSRRAGGSPRHRVDLPFPRESADDRGRTDEGRRVQEVREPRSAGRLLTLPSTAGRTVTPTSSDDGRPAVVLHLRRHHASTTWRWCRHHPARVPGLSRRKGLPQRHHHVSARCGHRRTYPQLRRKRPGDLRAQASLISTASSTRSRQATIPSYPPASVTSSRTSPKPKKCISSGPMPRSTPPAPSSRPESRRASTKNTAQRSADRRQAPGVGTRCRSRRSSLP